MIREFVKTTILKLWKLIPIFSLTNRDGYFSIDNDYSLNLFNFLFGEINIQILSFPILKRENIKFSIKKVCLYNKFKLSELENFNLSEDESDRLLNNYREHVKTLTQYDQEIEKEELLRKLSYEQERIIISYNKIYASVLAFLLIILSIISFIDLENISSQKWWQWIILFLFAYSVLNLLCLFTQALHIRGITLGSFGDIKNSFNKAIEQLVWIYYDWQQTKRRADLFVSFTSFTQEWAIRAIILFIIYIVL